MALWEISIQKNIGSEYWINVYHASVPDQAGAVDVANQVIAIERGAHMVAVSFVNFRVRQVDVLAQAGTVYPIGLTGQVGNTPYLPLFVVARVDFAVYTGRPSRKYMKFPISGSAVDNGNFTTAALGFYNTNYAEALEGVANLCDNNEQPFLSIKVNPTVGMRQLRRGSRKKETPIIP